MDVTSADHNPAGITGRWSEFIDFSAWNAGDLTLRPRATLNLLLREEPTVNPRIPRCAPAIYGISRDHDFLTLVDCARVSTRTFRKQGIVGYLEEYYPQYVYRGNSHISQPQENIFTEVSFTFQFDECVCYSSAFELMSPSREVSGIEFSADAEDKHRGFSDAFIAYYLNDKGPIFDTYISEFKGRLSGHFRSSFPAVGRGELQSRFALQIRYDAPQTHAQAHAHVMQCCFLMSYLISQKTVPQNIRLRWGKSDDSAKSCELIGPTLDELPPNNRLHPGDTFVCPDEDAGEFSRFVRRWFELESRRRNSRALYWDSLQRSNVFGPSRFLALFQAVEGLFITTSVPTLVDPQEFRKLRDLLIANLGEHWSQDVRTLLVNRFDGLNDPAPTARLADLVRRVNSSLSYGILVKEPEEFAKRIYRWRNRIAHGGRVSEDAASVQQFIDDTTRLSALYATIEAADCGLHPGRCLHKLMNSWWLPSLLHL